MREKGNDDSWRNTINTTFLLVTWMGRNEEWNHTLNRITYRISPRTEIDTRWYIEMYRDTYGFPVGTPSTIDHGTVPNDVTGKLSGDGRLPTTNTHTKRHLSWVDSCEHSYRNTLGHDIGIQPQRIPTISWYVHSCQWWKWMNHSSYLVESMPILLLLQPSVQS